MIRVEVTGPVTVKGLPLVEGVHSLEDRVALKLVSLGVATVVAEEQEATPESSFLKSVANLSQVLGANNEREPRTFSNTKSRRGSR